MGYRRNSGLPPILNTYISKSLEGNKILLVNLQEKRYITMDQSGNGEPDFGISVVRFYCKKGKKLPDLEIIICPLILMFNRPIYDRVIENFKIKHY